MRLLLTGCAAAALVVTGPLTATAADQGSQGPVGGDLLTAKPTVVADGATPPAVQASAYVVADLDTGAVLAAKAPHAKLRPASTLKTLTALVLLPRLKKTDQVVGTDADAGIIGSKVGVYPGCTTRSTCSSRACSWPPGTTPCTHCARTTRAAYRRPSSG